MVKVTGYDNITRIITQLLKEGKMKKFILLSLLFFPCYLLMANGFIEGEHIDFTKEFELADLKTVEVDLYVEDIEFMQHSGNKLVVNIIGEAPDKDINKFIDIDIDNDKFYIKSNITSIKTLKRYNVTIKVSLPETELDNFILSTSTGDLTVDKLHSSIVKVKSSTGNFNIGSVDARVINLVSSTGDKNIEKLNGKVINIKSSTGDLEAGSLNAERVVVVSSTGEKTLGSVESGESVFKSNTGDLEIDNISGNISVETSTGRINIKYDSFVHDIIDIHTSTGDVEIKLPNESEFALNLTSSTGKITCDYPVTLMGKKRENSLVGDVTSGDSDVFGHAEILVTTQTGDIKILNE